MNARLALVAAGLALAALPCAAGLGAFGLSLTCAGAATAIWAGVRLRGAATLTGVFALAHLAEITRPPAWLALATTAVLAGYLLLVEVAESESWRAGVRSMLPARALPVPVAVGSACVVLLAATATVAGGTAGIVLALLGVAALAAMLVLVASR
jgi:hypothetical protein